MFLVLALIVFSFPTLSLSAKFNLEPEYDKETIPEVPLEMTSIFEIKGITSIDFHQQSFGLDIKIYFEWNDSRISINGSDKVLKLKKREMKKFWLPYYDIYKDIGTKKENQKIKLHQGKENLTRVECILHLNIDINCSPMNFTDFPNDNQWCHFAMFSYEYTTSDILMESKLYYNQDFVLFDLFGATINISVANFEPYSQLSTTGRYTRNWIKMFEIHTISRSLG